MSKRYGQHCSVACALDLVGERWSLLIVRSLLLGPLRFTDLLGALPGMGTRMLADRLKNLTEAGVIASRELAPPASSVAYALTERGFELEPVLRALAQWGDPLLSKSRRADYRDEDGAALVMWRRANEAKRHPVANLQLNVGQKSYTFQARAGKVVAHRGDLPAPEATASASADDVFALLEHTLDVRRAVSSGRLTLTGAVNAETFREAFDLPAKLP